MLSLDSSVYGKLNAESIDERAFFITRQSWYAQYGKRIFDIVVALIASVLILSWMVPIIGFVIWATSPGPGLFVQLRTGRNGRIFRCLKFRTMYYAQGSEFTQAKLGDPRVTKIGRFLRRTNLDEMPQFWNVLLGEMSIVGPRPHPIPLDHQYWFKIDSYQFRYSVKPGITGLAQVRGARGETDTLLKMRHRVKYDLHYIKRQSVLVDVKLCWLTVRPMLKGNVNAW